MKFSVSQWAPDHGTPAEAVPEDGSAGVATDVEVPAKEWRALAPAGAPADDILFIDGVRRIDASLWIDQGDGRPLLGLAVSHAAGAVRSNGRARCVDTKVERGLFTSAAGSGDVATRHGTYRLRPHRGESPEELWPAIQQQMGTLEGLVAAGQPGAELLVLDGPLSHRRHVSGAVGYVKREHVEYLAPALWDVKYGLAVGRRTPLFVTTTAWSRYSWYLRLAWGAGPSEGLVRCEVVGDLPLAEAVRTADLVTATLPRFASAPHKDPRAPENLYPIGGLERELRHRLGEAQLMYRALRSAAAG